MEHPLSIFWTLIIIFIFAPSMLAAISLCFFSARKISDFLVQKIIPIFMLPNVKKRWLLKFSKTDCLNEEQNFTRIERLSSAYRTTILLYGLVGWCVLLQKALSQFIQGLPEKYALAGGALYILAFLMAYGLMGHFSKISELESRLLKKEAEENDQWLLKRETDKKERENER